MTMLGILMGVPALLGFTCILISRKTTAAPQGRGCQYPIVQTRKLSSVAERHELRVSALCRHQSPPSEQLGSNGLAPFG